MYTGLAESSMSWKKRTEAIRGPCMTTNPEASPCCRLFLRTHLLLVERLGLVVERGALLDRGEALDVECLPCCSNCGDPGALLGLGGALLGDDPSSLVLDEVALREAACGLGRLAC